MLILLAAIAAAYSPRAVAQFETRAGSSTGLNVPESVLTGDFNRDGNFDLAVVMNLPIGSVKILLGKGDGTFRSGPAYAVGVAPFFATAASLRQDGVLDLVVGDALSNNIYVLLGNGDGTFQSAVAFPTNGRPVYVGIGKFAGSGNLDIVDLTGNSAECNCVEVLPGNGDGTFRAAIDTPVPYNIDGFAMAVGDFNDDGKLDVAVGGGFFSTNQVDILLGNGDGTFTADGYYLLDSTPQSVATAYFTGNKKNLDLAIANEAGPGVAVLLGNGDGTFQQPTYYDTNFPTWVIATDLNGDGKVDLAASNFGLSSQYQPGVTVFRGNGDGTFRPGIFYLVGVQGDYVAAGDFNGDRRPDLVVVDGLGDEVYTLLNTGVVIFSPPTPLNFKDQAVGTTSAPLTVKVANTGTTTLKIASMKASAEFGVTSTCGASVAAGAKCTISVTFSPTKKGSQQGTITIIDSASTKPQVIEVLGTGT
jgi:hypothetical protein